MLHIKLKGITKCSSMVAYFARRFLPGDGSIGQNSTFSELGHVSYPIKGNHQMQQHGSKYFARRLLPDPAIGVKSSKWSGMKAMTAPRQEARPRQKCRARNIFFPSRSTKRYNSKFFSLYQLQIVLLTIAYKK